MACFTCIAEKNWKHYRALSHSVIQTRLDWDSWDQVPKHGRRLGQLSPMPTFLPRPWFRFPSRQQSAPATVLSQRLAQWGFDPSFKLLCYGNIDNNQWYKRRWLQGKMHMDARNTDGYIQSRFTFCRFTLSLVPLIFSECHGWWT